MGDGNPTTGDEKLNKMLQVKMEDAAELLSVSKRAKFQRDAENLKAAAAAAAEEKAKLQATKVELEAQAEQARTAAAELDAVRRAARPVRLKLRGRFYAASQSRRVAVTTEPPLAEELPPGCRLYEDAIPAWEIAASLAHLEQIIHGDQPDPRVSSITSGQQDKKRKQLKMEQGELGLFKSFKEALVDAGEAHGRELLEYNAISSLPGCTKQKLHWDYDPDRVRYARRKPCSAILGLQQGSRLYVYDTHLKREVTVLVPPGGVVVFDGDVAHRGASYAALNTRVHVYLDVAAVRRDQDYVWFPDTA